MEKIKNNSTHNTFVTLGASNHSKSEREENDYYATRPEDVKKLLDIEKFSNNIWEPACGGGHISEVLKRNGYKVYSTDLIDRGYGDEFFDFFSTKNVFNGDIITNPPYSMALEFLKHSLDRIKEGNKIAMLLKIQFLEGKARGKFYKTNPPKNVYVFSERTYCAKNGNFDKKETAICYCWFIWEKGFTDDTIVKWI